MRNLCGDHVACDAASRQIKDAVVRSSKVGWIATKWATEYRTLTARAAVTRARHIITNLLRPTLGLRQSAAAQSPTSSSRFLFNTISMWYNLSAHRENEWNVIVCWLTCVPHTQRGLLHEELTSVTIKGIVYLLLTLYKRVILVRLFQNYVFLLTSTNWENASVGRRMAHFTRRRHRGRSESREVTDC